MAWSADEASDAANAALRRFALRTRACTALAPIDHVFTHFRLRAHPVVLDCEAAEQGAGAALPTRWLALDEANEAPLPAPVKALLGALAARR